MPKTTKSHRTLKAAMRAMKLTERQLARRAGVHQSMINMLARRVRCARYPLADRLEKITGVPVKVLMTKPRPRHKSKAA